MEQARRQSERVSAFQASPDGSAGPGAPVAHGAAGARTGEGGAALGEAERLFEQLDSGSTELLRVLFEVQAERAQQERRGFLVETRPW